MLRNGWRPAGERVNRGRPPLAGGYYARFAHHRARMLHLKPRVARKLVPGNALWLRVLAHLRRGLSPERIASTLARMPVPVRLSRETIHTALHAMPRGQLRARVPTLLRRSHKNGLLRQHLPKGADLGLLSQNQLDDIAMPLNSRPRKSLGWKAPAELFLPEGAFDFVKHGSATINPVALGA